MQSVRYLAMNLPVFGIVLMFCEYEQTREGLIEVTVDGISVSPEVR